MPCFLLFLVLVVGHIGGAFRSGSGIPQKNNVSPIFFQPLCFALTKEANAPKRNCVVLFGAFCFWGLF